MQVFKLVKNGEPDRVIAFDELPESMIRTVRRGPIAGWPRHWREFMGVKRDDQYAMPFYILDYITMNADKEKWQEITSYVKRNIDPSVRLLDKVEAMAVRVAPDSYSDLTVEPEDVPVLKLPKAAAEPEAEAEEAPKRRGRKPKIDEALAV